MKPADAMPPRRPSAGLEALLVMALLLIVCVLAWPGMSAPLLLDDKDQLAHVARFTSWARCLGTDTYDLFRPVKNLIFFALAEAPLPVWHGFVLACFLIGTGGVYALLRRLTSCPLRALAGALLWACCPTQVSTAVWMSAANLSLAMGLSCGCILLHDLSRERDGHHPVLTTLACLLLLLAQLCYETAVAVPALCLLVDLLRKRPLRDHHAIMRYVMLGMVTLAYLAMRAHFGAVHTVASRNFGFDPDIQAWQLSASAPWFLWKHLSMWLAPAGRIEFCSSYLWGKSVPPAGLALCWLGLVLFIALIALCWKRWPMVSCGLAWFLIASFPPSNFVPIWSGPIEDYYLVFPSLGLVLALLGITEGLLAWSRSTPGRPLRLAALGLLALILVSRAACLPLFWLQADLWNRPIELYLRMVDSRPHQFQLQAVAAVELATLGRFDQAEELALAARQSGPWHPGSNMVLGICALRRGDANGAQTFLGQVLLKAPPDTPAHDFSRLHYARAMMQTGAPLVSVRETLLPLLKNPRGNYHIDGICLLVENYLAHKQPEDALRAARKALKLHPGNQRLTALLAGIPTAAGSPASQD